VLKRRWRRSASDRETNAGSNTPLHDSLNIREVHFDTVFVLVDRNRHDSEITGFVQFVRYFVESD
jgi:hypothetical protein